MRKRCTNSACRRSFSTADFGACPWCGKEYPRIQRGQLLVYSYGEGKVRTMWAVWKLSNCVLSEVRETVARLTKSSPIRVRIHCPEKRGEAERRLKEAKAHYRFC